MRTMMRAGMLGATLAVFTGMVPAQAHDETGRAPAAATVARGTWQASAWTAPATQTTTAVPVSQADHDGPGTADLLLAAAGAIALLAGRSRMRGSQAV